MTCKGLLLFGIACAVGCAEDVPTLYVTAVARSSVTLAPPDDHIPTAFGHYRWDLVLTPEGASESYPPIDETPAITIQPSTRGVYVYDRRFVGTASDQLSYHVVVTVEGAAPTAHIAMPGLAVIGQPAMLDGTSSSSSEQRTLMYEWRLALRPEGSMTELADTANAISTFVADITGDYGVELRVFDGELWSAPATVTVTAR